MHEENERGKKTKLKLCFSTILLNKQKLAVVKKSL